MTPRAFYFLVWLAALSGACQSQPTTHSAMPASSPERFRLSASPGCADGYPATIMEARFITPDGGSFPVPYGHLLTGNWGGSAVSWIAGDERQPAPDSLEIRWFSYTENKFYEGHFLLPQQHIHDLLKQGFWQPDLRQQATYSTLALSVVPGGVVVVWLVSQQNRVLIGRYQAREIAYDFETFAPRAERGPTVREEQAKLSPEVRREIAAGTLSSHRWDEYLRTYSWQVAFSQPVVVQDFSIDYLNAEATGYPATPDLAAYVRLLTSHDSKPVPQSLIVRVAGPYGRRCKLLATFEPAETQRAFQTLHTQHPHEPLTLYVELDERLSKATLLLRAGGQALPLPKSLVQLVALP